MADAPVAVCWKPVELRADVDPLTGARSADPRSLGVSPADEAALEWALRCAERSGVGVRVVAAGDDRAETVLREAITCGADDAVHVRCDADWPSAWVAHSLAEELRDASLVWCGDASSDRGSGSVPAFIAAELGLPQALGVVAVELGPPIEVMRRLDWGRRQRLRLASPAVVSCEGGTARLRRAPLSRVVAARTAPVRTVAANPSRVVAPKVTATAPFRPRARIVPPPLGTHAIDRIRTLTGIASGRGPAASGSLPLRLEPDEAAAAILDALRNWGELPDDLDDLANVPETEQAAGETREGTHA